MFWIMQTHYFDDNIALSVFSDDVESVLYHVNIHPLLPHQWLWLTYFHAVEQQNTQSDYKCLLQIWL